MSIGFGVASTSGTTAMAGSSGNSTLTTPLPTSWAAGQLAILAIYLDQGVASTPAGWTPITGNPFGAGTPKLYLFTRILQVGDSNPASTISGSATNASNVGAIATYTGVNTTDPISVVGTPSNGTGTPMTAGSIDTITDGSWVLGICGRGDNEAATTQTFGGSATGVNLRFDSGTSAGNDSEVSLYDKEIVLHGSSGNGSAVTNATDPWVSVLIALEPDNVPRSPTSTGLAFTGNISPVGSGIVPQSTIWAS